MGAGVVVGLNEQEAILTQSSRGTDMQEGRWEMATVHKDCQNQRVCV